MADSRPCKKCRAQIRLIENRATGKFIPAQKVKTLYIEVEGKLLKLELSGPFFISHYETCPDADQFGKGQK